MITVGEAFSAASRRAAGAVTLLADAIAPPIGIYASPERVRVICPDPDHAEVETPCPTCGQGPRER